MIKTLVIHPDHLKERGEHIDCMLRGMGLDYEFVNEGHDDKQIDSYIHQYLRNGREQLQRRIPRALCTISHFLAYEKIVAENWEGALVLEDDIVLNKGFCPYFERSIEEYRRNYTDKNILISYEDSSLRFVPRSRREKGRMLYPADKGRMSGAYFINANGARSILRELRKEPCDLAIDWYHSELIKKGLIDCLWCHPTIATQGSFSGRFASALTTKNDWMVSIRWWFKKNYKKMLYWFR